MNNIHSRIEEVNDDAMHATRMRRVCMIIILLHNVGNYLLFMKQIIITAELLLRYEDKNQSVVT